MKARDNPFATDRVERLLTFRPEWAGTDWSSIDQRWQQLGQRAAVTGRHGAGKTTFIDAWKARKITAGHEILSFFLNADQKNLSADHWQTLENSTGKTVILDGEEQLNWWARRRFHQVTHRCAGLLITRHQPNKLPNLLHLDPDIGLIHRCVNKLSPHHYPELAPLLPSMWQKHRGNLRAILLACYDSTCHINR